MKIEPQVSFPKLVITAETAEDVYDLMLMFQNNMLPIMNDRIRRVAARLEAVAREHFNMHKEIK